ncbi:hypothetical protein OKW50_002965 [Paraburkholderia youngii]|uniref:Uncharacterized protein n=1 Tax=Paraburkholderia youngii TaxID=2782701 RepID=A0A7W8P2Y4_9BURK|nr:hypothetical protein [Paraburkholderia youngii]MBB5400470.1 hypothetical protein [Paraburkholderia youngii]
MRAVNLGGAKETQTKPRIKVTHADVTPGSGFTVRDVVEIDGIPRKKVAFSVRYENNVLFYRFASELTCFRLTRNKLWHNPGSFPRRATASDGTRSNGTVPVKQNLIQVDGVPSPCLLLLPHPVNVPDSVRFFAAAAHSDHPIIETSQR